MSVHVPLEPDRVKVKLLVAPFGIGEIVRLDDSPMYGLFYGVARHKDRRFEWYQRKQFDIIEEP